MSGALLLKQCANFITVFYLEKSKIFQYTRHGGEALQE